jgi:hypothetical protein
MAGAVLIPRNAAFESLCAVAGGAHNSDARLNPASTLDWEFAVAVLKLNRHPMSWLLRWASIKISMDRHRCRMHCDLDSSTICLTTDRGEAVKANH